MNNFVSKNNTNFKTASFVKRMLLVLVLLFLTKGVGAKSIESKPVKYIKIGKLYFYAENFFSSGWQLNRGDLIINAKNVKLKNEKETLVVTAKNAVLKFQLSSFFRFNFVPQIEKLEGARVILRKSNEPGTKVRTAAQKIRLVGDAVSFLEEVISNLGNDLKDTTKKEILNDVQMQLFFGSEFLDLKIDKAYLEKKDFSLDNKTYGNVAFRNKIIADIVINGKTASLKLSCNKNIGKKSTCFVGTNGKLGRYINQFIKIMDGRYFFDFSELNTYSYAIFGSTFGQKIYFFWEASKTSPVRLFDGTSINISTSKARGILDVQKQEFVLFPFKIDVHDFTKGSFGMMLNFRDVTKKFFSFEASEISGKHAVHILNLLKHCNKNMNDGISSTLDNVTIMGGNFDVKQSRIEYDGQSMMPDLYITFQDTIGQIRQANNLMVRDSKGSVQIMKNITKVEVESGKIGNDFFDKASAHIHYKTNSPSLLRLLFHATGMQVGNLFGNRSMPTIFKKIIESLKFKYGALISGEVGMDFILNKNFNPTNDLKMNGIIELFNLNNPFARTYKKPIIIHFQKEYNNPDIGFHANFADSKLMYAYEDVVIKDRLHEMRLSGSLKNFFLYNQHFSIPNLSGIRKKADQKEEGVLDAEFDSVMKDGKIKTFTANIKKLLLLGSNMSGTVELDEEQIYKIRLTGDYVNWKNFQKILGYKKNYDANPILRSKLKGYFDFDEIVMFNNVKMQNFSANVDLMNGVFNKLNISSDVLRVDDDGKQIVDYGYKKDFDKKDLLDSFDTTKHISPLLIVAEKSESKNTIYGYFTNARLLFDAFDMGGFYNRISGGSFTFDGSQNASGVVGNVVLKDFYYYPSNSFNGDLSTVDIPKGLVVDNFNCTFDYNIKKMILQIKKGSLISNGITSTANGYIDFVERTVYFNGNIKIFSRKTGQFEFENVPVVGNALYHSVKKRRALLSFSYTVDGSLDNLEKAVKIKPSKSMFVFISLGGFAIAVTVALLLALI